MKNLILAALVAVFAVPSFATSIDRTQVVAVVENAQRGMLNTVALLADGRIQIKLDDKLIQKVLAPSTFSFLMQAAHAVVGSESTYEVRPNICYFIIAPDSPSLSVASVNQENYSFTGKPVLRLTATHCGMKNVVYPTEPSSYRSAESLRDQLIVLALEIAKSIRNGIEPQ